MDDHILHLKHSHVSIGISADLGAVCCGAALEWCRVLAMLASGCAALGKWLGLLSHTPAACVCLCLGLCLPCRAVSLTGQKIRMAGLRPCWLQPGVWAGQPTTPQAHPARAPYAPQWTWTVACMCCPHNSSSSSKDRTAAAKPTTRRSDCQQQQEPLQVMTSVRAACYSHRTVW